MCFVYSHKWSNCIDWSEVFSVAWWLIDSRVVSIGGSLLNYNSLSIALQLTINGAIQWLYPQDLLSIDWGGNCLYWINAKTIDNCHRFRQHKNDKLYCWGLLMWVTLHVLCSIDLCTALGYIEPQQLMYWRFTYHSYTSDPYVCIQTKHGLISYIMCKPN